MMKGRAPGRNWLTLTPSESGITLRGKRLAAVTAGAAALVGIGTVGGAVAGVLVTSSQIKDNTIRSRDVHDGTLKQKDLNPSATATFKKQLRGYHVLHQSWTVPALTPTDNNDGVAHYALGCPHGEAVLSGNYALNYPPQYEGKPFSVYAYDIVAPTDPWPDQGSFAVTTNNQSDVPVQLDVWAVCAKFAP
jgi:hypothetical protein